ncbi:unannotated protein [freshwater metagenome]|uniref:Unannotated protein n=1 Tax=freshwater metagenome TaxID=449393 RepID=A0A6J7G5H9_9ZZZZ
MREAKGDQSCVLANALPTLKVQVCAPAKDCRVALQRVEHIVGRGGCEDFGDLYWFGEVGNLVAEALEYRLKP